MTAPIVLAVVGGFFVNILQLMEYANRPKLERPDFKDGLFYVPYVAWPTISGVLAYAYIESGVVLSPIIGLNVGLSAPLLIRAMTEANPFKASTIDPGNGA